MTGLTNTLVLYILDIFSSVLSLLLKPIDFLLTTIVPNYSVISGYVISFFTYFRDTFLFVINWVHLPPAVITMILGYITFKVSLYFGTLTYKLFIRWYRTLKS